MNTLSIDWNEVVLLVIGALIGMLGSIATMLIQEINSKVGKLEIYSKFTCLKNMGQEGWGVFLNDEGGRTLLIPTIFEIENTSKRARVMRDVSLVLLKGNTVVGKMVQLNYLQTTSRTNNQITKTEEHFYGDEKGSYSFVVDAVSIKRENCVYSYKVPADEIGKMEFDSIGLQYYDEKNHKKMFIIREYPGWKIKNNEVDADWIYIKEKVKG